MNSHNFEDWLQMNRAAMAPVAQWYEIATEATQKTVQYNLSVLQNCLDFGSRQMDLMRDLKEPQKFGVEAAKLASDMGQKVVDRTGDFIKIVRETQEAVVQWTENSAKAAMDASRPKA